MRTLASTGLSADDLYTLSRTTSLLVESGADRVTPDFQIAEPLADYVTGGSMSVAYDSTQPISGSVQVTMSVDNPVLLGDFFSPWMRLTDQDTGISATFRCGVYTLTSPQYNLGDLVDVPYTGYDLCSLLDQPYPDSFYCGAGTSITDTVAALVRQIIPGAVFNITVSDQDTLTTTVVYPLSNSSTTYLTIINGLLAAIGDDNLYTDWDGTFIIEPYVSPLERNSEWYFDADDVAGNIGEDRTLQQDVYNVPNQWVFIMANLSAAPVEGATQYTYTDLDPDSPSSIGGRSFFWRKQYFVNATNYQALVQAGNAQITIDKAPAETITFTTSPLPIAWRWDQITYHDSALENVPPSYFPFRRLVGKSWTLPFDGSDMSWSVQTASL